MITIILMTIRYSSRLKTIKLEIRHMAIFAVIKNVGIKRVDFLCLFK